MEYRHVKLEWDGLRQLQTFGEALAILGSQSQTLHPLTGDGRQLNCVQLKPLGMVSALTIPSLPTPGSLANLTSLHTPGGRLMR